MSGVCNVLLVEEPFSLVWERSEESEVSVETTEAEPLAEGQGQAQAGKRTGSTADSFHWVGGKSRREGERERDREGRGGGGGVVVYKRCRRGCNLHWRLLVEGWEE